MGRCLHDRGLTVALKVCEDLESFEATTDIEVTSPAQPWLGLVRLSDNGHIEEMGVRLPRRLPRRPRHARRRDHPRPARRPHIDQGYPVTGQLAAVLRLPAPVARPLMPHRLPKIAGACRKMTVPARPGWAPG